MHELCRQFIKTHNWSFPIWVYLGTLFEGILPIVQNRYVVRYPHLRTLSMLMGRWCWRGEVDPRCDQLAYCCRCSDEMARWILLGKSAWSRQPRLVGGSIFECQWITFKRSKVGHQPKGGSLSISAGGSVSTGWQYHSPTTCGSVSTWRSQVIRSKIMILVRKPPL